MFGDERPTRGRRPCRHRGCPRGCRPAAGRGSGRHPAQRRGAPGPSRLGPAVMAVVEGPTATGTGPAAQRPGPALAGGAAWLRRGPADRGAWLCAAGRDRGAGAGLAERARRRPPGGKSRPGSTSGSAAGWALSEGGRGRPELAGRPARVHLKIDTGLAPQRRRPRGVVRPRRRRGQAARARACSSWSASSRTTALRPTSPTNPSVAAQTAAFTVAGRTWPPSGGAGSRSGHLANSAALLTNPALALRPWSGRGSRSTA